MARAARTASVIVVLLGALALMPSIAQAVVSGTTTVTFPAEVTVGETQTATITLTNTNAGSEESDANTVCEDGDGDPCPGEGILLVPACGVESGMAVCSTGHQDPDVLEFDSTAAGVALTACAGMTFSVTVADPVTGKLLIAPSPTEDVVLQGPLMAPANQCKIDLAFTVVGMPNEDLNVETAEIETEAIVSATQRSASSASTSQTSSITSVFPATPSIATQASPAIALGGTVTDTATVTGRVNPSPGATVTLDRKSVV